MKNYNVLVFPAETEIANEVINSLKNHKYFNIIYANSEVGDYYNYNENTVHYLPYISELNFEEEIKKLIQNLNIDFLVPCHDDVAYKFSEIENTLKEINCKVIGQNFKVNEIVRYKDKTYDFFQNILPTPKVLNYNKLKEEDFPIFVKPKKGQGSLNACKISNSNELKLFFSNFKPENFVITEYLDGKEFTIDCFSNFSKVLFFGPRERKKTFKGISIHSSLLNKEDTIYKELEEYAQIISKELNLHGIWFFQAKLGNDNKAKLLEIGPRISGTMMLNRVRGINFIEIALYQSLGMDISIITNDFDVALYKSLVPKYKLNINYDYVYVDFDDCLCINNKINTELIAFLYQCVNAGKKIILISKNKNNLKKSLKQMRIYDLFDKIFHLKKDDEKFKYIKNKNAIFIDDSFSERKKIYEKLKIPVFSVDAIECLVKK